MSEAGKQAENAKILGAWRIRAKRSAMSSSKEKGSSVKNKFQNDGNFMAQFRQQMKVRVTVGEEVS